MQQAARRVAQYVEDAAVFKNLKGIGTGGDVVEVDEALLREASGGLRLAEQSDKHASGLRRVIGCEGQGFRRLLERGGEFAERCFVNARRAGHMDWAVETAADASSRSRVANVRDGRKQGCKDGASLPQDASMKHGCQGGLLSPRPS